MTQAIVAEAVSFYAVFFAALATIAWVILYLL